MGQVSGDSSYSACVRPKPPGVHLRTLVHQACFPSFSKTRFTSRKFDPLYNLARSIELEVKFHSETRIRHRRAGKHVSLLRAFETAVESLQRNWTGENLPQDHRYIYSIGYDSLHGLPFNAPLRSVGYALILCIYHSRTHAFSVGVEICQSTRGFGFTRKSHPVEAGRGNLSKIYDTDFSSN